MKNCLLIIALFFISINSKSQSLNNPNDKSKQNPDWIWWVDEITGKGEWMHGGDETTVENGHYTLFYFNGNPYERGTVKNGNNVDTIYGYNVEGKLDKYGFIRLDPFSKYVIDDGTNIVNTYIINDGVFKIYRNDGTISGEGYSKNHKPFGPWTDFYKNGNKKCVENFNKDSNWRIDYYENGQKEDSSYNFPGHGVFVDCKRWYENGQLKGDAEWVNGIENGVQHEYFEADGYPKSLIKSISIWKNGVESGVQLDYYENGRLNDSINVVNGLQDGITKHYYENSGMLKSFESWKKGVRDGFEIGYFENGKMSYSFNYVNGKEVGIAKNWYENGQLKLSTTFQDGYPVYQKMWCENGTVVGDTTISRK
jgi:antitoxin component YwqK of YwqJK toxin-antitoxin module